MFIDYDTIMPFGKHFGSTGEEILETDPSYLIWLDSTMENEVDSDLLDEAILNDSEIRSFNSGYNKYDDY